MPDPRSSADLTKEQLDAVHARLREPQVYLQHLAERMRQCRFPKDDELLVKAEAAVSAIQALNMAVHYAACEKLKPGSTMKGGR